MGKVCSNCGSEMKDDAKFCGKCGSKYTGITQNDARGRRCQKCGTGLKSGMNFCPKCGSEFVQSHTRKKKSKKKKKMIIAIVAVILLGIIIFMPGNSDSTESVNLGKNSDSTKGVNKEDVKRKICENLDIDYNPDEWVIDSQNSVEYYISGNFIMMLQLNDKKGDVMKTGVGASLNPYSDVENPMQEGTDIQGVFKDHIDKEFTWKCAAVSAMLDCDMDKAASIVRKANKSSSGTTKVDNIVINPHTEVDNTSIFWVINANYAGE